MIDFCKTISEMRAHVPVTRRWAYLETSSTGLISDFVYEGVRRYADARYYQGGDSLWEYNDGAVGTLEMMRRAKEALAAMIHCDADDIAFGQSSTQLHIKQIEINIDYILMLMQKYRDSHGKNKEIAIAIQKAVESSSELRSKKALIQGFLAGINDVDDVVNAWHDFVAVEKETQLAALIAEERLKDAETRQFMANAFRDGAIKTTGTEIDGLLPPMSRFGGGNRAEKKRVGTEKLVAFFDRFFGIG